MGSQTTGALGARAVINAAATLTVLGGGRLPDEVVRAMVEASRTQVDMHELFVLAGEQLAALTRNEAAYVTCGAASAIAHGVMACVTAGDPAAIAAMPRGEALRTNVVMHCAHRIPYDRVIELVGCSIVQVGNAIQTFDWELERALTDRVACVIWVAGSHLPPASLSLERTVAIAHARGVPVLVDAAAQLPPVRNLWHFTREAGADLAAFSGGKAMRGPQASGLLVGRADLIAAARANGTPNQRLLRSLKVGREEIAGLVAAVARYVDLDHEALLAGWEATVSEWIEQLAGIAGVRAERVWPNEAGQPTPRLAITVDPAVLGRGASDLVAALWGKDPRIAVLPGVGDVFYVTPDTLNEGEADLVIRAVTEALGRTRPASPTTRTGDDRG
ncbi:MAG TPA: aminotransferase class V-fold PLP-dependent enzyme [Propionicimonas sp.]|jgi:L-seryl-tRNA(Ser) seleniumtransferase